MRQKDPGVLHKQFSLPPSLVARTQHRRLSCDRALSCACWGEPPPASLRGWCSEVTLLGRRAFCCVSVCVCGCLPALNGKKACALLLFIFSDFTSSSKNYFWCVFRCRQCVLYYLAVCLQCNVLCFTSNPYLPVLSLCPALPQPHGDASGSGNMGRGTQGGRTPQLERNSNEPAQSHSLFPRQQAPNK